MINKAEMFRKAHFTARWRSLSARQGETYRELFAAALRYEYKKARMAREARQRREQSTGPTLDPAACLAPRYSYTRRPSTAPLYAGY